MDPHIVWVDDDGVVHIRNSERGTLDRCPQQWWWAWREGLRPKETAKPLWFGTAIHAALAEYYRPGKKRSKNYIDKFRESADMEAEYIRTNVGSVDEDEWVDARVLGETMLKGYVERYEGDKDWDVIATEQSFELAIPYSWTDDTLWLKKAMKRHGINTQFFILNGTFDGVYRDRKDKRIKLMEHKTAASVSIRHLPMDNQAGTYHAVAQTVGRSQGWLTKTELIKEITYNFLRKAMPTEKPRDAQGYVTNKPLKDQLVNALMAAGVEWPVGPRGGWKVPTIAELEEMCTKRGLVVLGPRAKVQPPPLYERHPVRKTPRMRATQVERLQAEVLRMNAYVIGALPLSKSPDRNHCGFCAYAEMCELHERGSDWVEYRDALMRASDPYADHRKSAST
jgi:hypothetical protein